MTGLSALLVDGPWRGREAEVALRAVGERAGLPFAALLAKARWWREERQSNHCSSRRTGALTHHPRPQVDALAARLPRSPARAQPTVVATSLPQGEAWVVSLLAILASGAAPLALDPLWPAPRTRAALELAAASAVVWGDATGRPPADAVPPGVELVAAGEGSKVARARRADAPVPTPFAACLTTSGHSDAGPTIACIPWAGLAARAAWAATALGLAPGAVAAARCPPWTADAVSEVLTPLLAGATVVCFPPACVATGAALARAVRAEAPTFLSLTPSLWGALLRSDPGGGCLASLRAAVSTGEPLPRPLAAALAAAAPAACALLNVYGMAEAAADATAADVRAWLASGGSDAVVPAGAAVAGARVWVASPASDPLTPLPADMSGVVCVAGPGVATALLRAGGGSAPGASRLTTAADGAPTLVTADLGTIDAAGVLRVTGRTTRDARDTRGGRVSLVAVEAALLALPGVAAAAVVVGPGNSLTAYVEGSATADALESALPAGARAVSSAAPLPLSAAGKVDRAALRDRPTHPLTESAVAAAMAAVLGAPVEAAQPFWGDSLQLAEVATALGVPPVLIIDGRSPRGVAALAAGGAPAAKRARRAAPPAKVAWRVPMDACVDAPVSLIGGGLVVAGDAAGGVVAAAARGGSVAWRVGAGGHAFLGACAVGATGVIAVAHDTPSLTWVRASDGGAAAAPTALRAPPRGPPAACPWAPGTAWVGTRDGHIVCAAPDGRGVLWEVAAAADGASLAGAPTPAGGRRAFATTLAPGGGSLIALTGSLTPPAIAWAASAWRAPLFGGAAPLARGGAAAADAAGVLAAFDAEGVPLWRVELDGPVMAPLTLAGSLVVAAQRAGGLAAVAARGGRLAWTAPTPPLPTPAVELKGRLLIVAEDGTAVTLDAATGATVPARALGAEAFSAPAALPGGRALVGTRGDEVVCFEVQ